MFSQFKVALDDKQVAGLAVSFYYCNYSSGSVSHRAVLSVL